MNINDLASLISVTPSEFMAQAADALPSEHESEIGLRKSVAAMKSKMDFKVIQAMEEDDCEMKIPLEDRI